MVINYKQLWVSNPAYNENVIAPVIKISLFDYCT